MGCDYFIIKQLNIEYLKDNDNTVYNDIIELEKQNCYFNNQIEDLNYDSDDSTNSECNDNSNYLKVTHIPRILFKNSNWKNNILKEKYENFIFDELNNCNIIKIIKMETRNFN